MSRTPLLDVPLPGIIVGVVALIAIPLWLVYSSRNAVVRRNAALAAAKLIDSVGMRGLRGVEGVLYAYWARSGGRRFVSQRFEPGGVHGGGGLLAGQSEVLIVAPGKMLEEDCCPGVVVAFLEPGEGRAGASVCDARGCARADLSVGAGGGVVELQPGGRWALATLCASPRDKEYPVACRVLAASRGESVRVSIRVPGKPMILVVAPGGVWGWSVC